MSDKLASTSSIEEFSLALYGKPWDEVLGNETRAGKLLTPDRHYTDAELTRIMAGAILDPFKYQLGEVARANKD